MAEEILKNDEDVIITQDLTKKYDKLTAVDHLNLRVKKGEVFGLLGPNGAGKTTTTLMLLGLTEPTSGKACINGIDCTSNQIEIKKRVGYLPDNVGFYPDMTGRENLNFTGRLNGLYGKELEIRVNELLERVSLSEAADKKTKTYSRGMRQRLGIADVLLKDPEIIIMDEPTLGIDPEGIRELNRMIRELAKKDGRTILLSSHQLYQVQKICDRMGIFVKGKLIAAGTLEELNRQLQSGEEHTLEIGFFENSAAAAPLPGQEEILRLLMEKDYILQAGQEGSYYIVRTKGDRRIDLMNDLREKGLMVVHIRQLDQELDEIYKKYFEKAGEILGNN